MVDVLRVAFLKMGTVLIHIHFSGCPAGERHSVHLLP